MKIKNFFYWLAWFIRRHGNWAGIIALISCFGIMVLCSFLIFKPIAGIPIFVMIIGILSTVVFLFIFISTSFYSSPRNPRIAIEEAKGFAREYPEHSSQINTLIEETERTGDSSKLNELVSSCWTLTRAKRELIELEKRQREKKKQIESLEARLSQ